MTAESGITSASSSWTLGLAEQIDIPGWFAIPESATPEAQDTWVSQNAHQLRSLVGSNRWDGQPTTEKDIEDVLRSAFAERASTDSDVLLQVWPVPYPATILCHLDLVTSATLPHWPDVDGIVHPVEAPYLGQGIQVSTRGVEDGIELASVHLIFDNGEVALVMSIEEAPAMLVSRVLPEFMMLSEALRIDGPDREPLVGVLPVGQIPEEAPWDFEETGTA